MATKVEHWKCGVCHNLHSSEESAKHCETVHVDRSKAYIKGMYFPIMEEHYQRQNKVRYPTSVIIAFTESIYDYASYRLERVGPQGM